MSFLYVWKSTNLPVADARSVFANMLSEQSAFYTQAFGREFAHRIHQIDTVFIGQITFDLGVNEWQPWVDGQGAGVAWSGVCEEFLGAGEPSTHLAHIFDTVEKYPARLADWDGRFALCAWQEASGRVLLTTGATDSPTLWYTEGPHGWAAGSRAAPLMELVGRQPSLNPESVNLFIAYGYLVGDQALFRDVKRIPQRHQVRLSPNEQPSVHTYISLVDYLDAPGLARSPEEQARHSADRLLQRVARQLKYSNDPHLLLTGGRDSRCIAAAAVKAGYRGGAHTTGSETSKEVLIAAKVARALGIEHERLGDFGGGRSPLASMARATSELAMWTRISEGAETIRHAVPFQAFFERQLPFPARKRQVFHGLHSFGNSYYNKRYNLEGPYQADDARAIVLQKIPGSLALRQPIDEAVLRVCDQIDAELGGMSLTLAQWLNLFYWQTKCNHWGEDMMSVKDLIDWHWAPLFDRPLIQAHWRQKVNDKLSKTLVQGMTVLLAPQLQGMEYDKELSGVPSTFAQLTNRIKKKLSRYTQKQPQIATRHTSDIPADQHLFQFWNTTLFDDSAHAWPAFIDQEQLRGITEANPLVDTLWRVATIELVAKTHVEHELAV